MRLRMEEQELMRLVQEGDEDAFEQIVTIYKNKIVNFLWQLTGDYEKAVELAQETFMRVYFKAEKYRPIAALSSWIYTIASNLAKTEMKKLRRYPTISLDDVRNGVGHVDMSVDHPEQSELIKNLRQALAALHPRYRIPIILKDIEGFSQDEIAEILHKPVGTIKARISRGRNYLKKALVESEHSVQSFVKQTRYENGRA